MLMLTNASAAGWSPGKHNTHLMIGSLIFLAAVFMAPAAGSGMAFRIAVPSAALIVLDVGNAATALHVGRGGTVLGSRLAICYPAWLHAARGVIHVLGHPVLLVLILLLFHILRF